LVGIGWYFLIVDNDGDLTKLSLPSMRRRLHRRRDSVAAFVVMASLSSPMRRRLAVVVDDGDGMTGKNGYDLVRSLATAVAAMSPASSASLASA